MGINKSQISHLLVIRFSALGDVAMTAPVLLELSKQYPNLKITVLTKGFVSPLFLQLSNVTVFNADLKGQHKGILGLFKLYKELKTLKIDAVADLHNVLRTKILKAYFLFSNIPFIQIDKGRNEKRALTSFKNKVFKQLKSTHQRYADVFFKLRLPIDLNKARPLKKEELNAEILAITGVKAKKWVGIAPFAAHEGKMYPFEQMKNVVQELQKNSDIKIFLFGGGKEEVKKLNDLETKSCINVAGKLSFTHELALISNLDIMVAMDSANAHLGALYGVTTVTIWGVTHPYAGFYPFKQDHSNAILADRNKYPLIPTSIYGNKVPAGYHAVMTTITPERIVNKIKANL